MLRFEINSVSALIHLICIFFVVIFVKNALFSIEWLKLCGKWQLVVGSLWFYFIDFAKPTKKLNCSVNLFVLSNRIAWMYLKIHIKLTAIYKVFTIFFHFDEPSVDESLVSEQKSIFFMCKIHSKYFDVSFKLPSLLHDA